MKAALPVEAVSFGEAARSAFSDVGGVDAARRAEEDPASRSSIRTVLDQLGIRDLDPRADLDTAAAAGELCREAGRVALPYPVVSVLVSIDERPMALIPATEFPVDHGDLFPSWVLAHVDGSATVAAPTDARLASRLGPFVTIMQPREPAAGAPTTEVLLHFTLTAWQILGTLERAVELAVEHVTGRIQFGKPLAANQAVQFQLADAAVAVDGLREVCRYTLWRVFDAGDAALTDVLAARLAALDAARLVLRTTQQLHGAAGVCDEYDISVLSRHVQPALRIPFGSERTAAEMAGAVSLLGFESLFPHGRVRR
jgi:hypothetical protein